MTPINANCADNVDASLIPEPKMDGLPIEAQVAPALSLSLALTLALALAVISIGPIHPVLIPHLRSLHPGGVLQLRGHACCRRGCVYAPFAS